MPSPAAPRSAEPSCAVATTDDVARVTVSGEIDLGTALLLADALRHAEEHDTGVVVDLSGVEFMDSRGVQLLLASARRVRARGGRFRLDGVSDTVARLLGVLASSAKRLQLPPVTDAIAGPRRAPPLVRRGL